MIFLVILWRTPHVKKGHSFPPSLITVYLGGGFSSTFLLCDIRTYRLAHTQENEAVNRWGKRVDFTTSDYRRRITFLNVQPLFVKRKPTQLGERSYPFSPELPGMEPGTKLLSLPFCNIGHLSIGSGAGWPGTLEDSVPSSNFKSIFVFQAVSWVGVSDVHDSNWLKLSETGFAWLEANQPELSAHPCV